MLQLTPVIVQGEIKQVAWYEVEHPVFENIILGFSCEYTERRASLFNFIIMTLNGCYKGKLFSKNLLYL
jgi:hypothetical protein